MLNKKTLLFFTDKYNTEVANNVMREYADDNSVIAVVITRKEVANFVVNAAVDKLIPEDTAFRNALHNKRTLIGSLNSGRIQSQNITFSKRNPMQKRILNALRRYNPNVVAVTTHTLLSDVLAAVDKYSPDVKVAVICEDFVLDKRLIQRNVHYYFVDNYDMRNVLADGGIPDAKIEIASLPIGREYFEKNNREEAIKKFALDANKPTILISASTLGDNRFKKVLEEIKQASFDANFVVACGKNRSFINAARELGFSAYNEGIDMNAALNACDLLVARPTTMLMGEAIVKGKTIFGLLPNGNTEAANLKYLSLDAVTAIENIPDLLDKIGKFISDYYNKDKPDGENTEATEEQIIDEAMKIAPIEETSAKRIANKLVELASESEKEKEEE